jgi:hypothetical protein
VRELDINKNGMQNERGGYEIFSSFEGCMLFYLKTSEKIK